jgi:hypothetical protein
VISVFAEQQSQRKREEDRSPKVVTCQLPLIWMVFALYLDLAQILKIYILLLGEFVTHFPWFFPLDQPKLSTNLYA